MPVNSLLYSSDIEINKYISIQIPTVGEIMQDECAYYDLVYILTAMPIDMMVQLDDIGIDYTTITDYDLFLMTFQGLKKQDTHLIFGNLDLSKFQLAVHEQTNQTVLINTEDDIKIDKAIYSYIATTLRKIHHLEKNNKKPANKDAQEYMLKRARTKLKRRKNKKRESQIESLIIAMVNTEQYKYNFQSTRDLTIYQFNESVKQVIKKVDYDNKMYGVYTGTIKAKELSQNDLNWLYTK